MPAPWLLALGLILGLIVLIPARRLQIAGFSALTTGTYAAVLWLVGMLIAVRGLGLRFMVPILLIAYLAPFVAGPERMARIVRRQRPPGSTGSGGVPPMKNVTPPDDVASDDQQPGAGV